MGTQVRMMYEPDTIGSQHARQFGDKSVDDIRLRVDERIEAEDKIDRSIRNHRKRSSVVRNERGIFGGAEALLARLDTPLGQIDANISVARREQIPGPPPMAWSNF